MSSLADDNERINDDPIEVEPGAAGRATDNDEPKIECAPPTATDFSRATTRYMIAAREWTRAQRDHALEVLRRAVVAWSGVFWVTFWKWRGFQPFTGTAQRPGHGSEHQTTVLVYGAWLAEGSQSTYPKGQAVCVTLARCRYRGHSDNECVLRSGIFMDSDECGGWDESRALCREVGLAFVGQMRPIAPDRHHLEIPLASPMVPERDDTGVATWKRNVYCPKLGWTLGILSELAGLRYDPFWDEGGHASAKHAGYDSACDQLTHLNFVYTRRPDDPPDHVPVTDYAAGRALDIDALLALTGFDAARERLDRSVRYIERTHTKANRPGPRARPAGLKTVDEQPATMANSRISTVALLVRLRRLSNPESKKLIQLCLEGRSYAALGARDTTMWRIASIVAALAPNEDPEHLAHLLFKKSLETMARLPGAEPVVGYVETYLALAAEKIARAQRNVRTGAQ